MVTSYVTQYKNQVFRCSFVLVYQNTLTTSSNILDCYCAMALLFMPQLKELSHVEDVLFIAMPLRMTVEVVGREIHLRHGCQLKTKAKAGGTTSCQIKGTRNSIAKTLLDVLTIAREKRIMHSVQAVKFTFQIPQAVARAILGFERKHQNTMKDKLDIRLDVFKAVDANGKGNIALAGRLDRVIQLYVNISVVHQKYGTGEKMNFHIELFGTKMTGSVPAILIIIRTLKRQQKDMVFGIQNEFQDSNKPKIIYGDVANAGTIKASLDGSVWQVESAIRRIVSVVKAKEAKKGIVKVKGADPLTAEMESDGTATVVHPSAVKFVFGPGGEKIKAICQAYKVGIALRNTDADEKSFVVTPKNSFSSLRLTWLTWKSVKNWRFQMNRS
jgi:hypothetical protein